VNAAMFLQAAREIPRCSCAIVALYFTREVAFVMTELSGS
jgi:hypothetical protein